MFVDRHTPSNIVYPIRVDKEGKELKARYHRTERRSKRQTIIENSQDDQQPIFLERNYLSGTIPDDSKDTNVEFDNSDISSDEEIFVRIENEDEDLFLQLRPNHNLQTKGTVIEWVLPGGTTVLKTSPEDCYLIGNSVGEEGSSLVAVSSCSGLTGLIQTSKNSYFIEPLTIRHNGNPNKSDIRDGFYTEDFIKRYRNHTSLYRNKPLEEVQSIREDKIRTAYQHQRGYQEVLSLPEAHVIYKVNTILERLNISLQEDQKFDWNDQANNTGSRKRRSNLDSLSRNGRMTNIKKGHGRKKNNSYNKNIRRKKSDNKQSRKNKRRRRNRRHNRRLRQQCQQLAEGNNMHFNNETRQQCLQEEQRKIRRREERQTRRLNREKKFRTRESRRKAREKKKREKQEKRSRRRDQNQTNHSSSKWTDNRN